MIKDNFPYFKNNKIYLDNGSTTQKPQIVLDSIMDYYTNYCSNTHRGSYSDGNQATIKFEEAREYIKSFLNVPESGQVVFTKGVTEGINMVASAFVDNRYDNVIISSLEHHSNITPWHIQGRSPGRGLKVIKYKKDLSMDLNHLEELLKEPGKNFVSITHISNAFGVVHPVKEIVELAHIYGAQVLIDGAQVLSRIKPDISEIQPDFYVFSSHKSYGPTGVGGLYIHGDAINDFMPYQTGGAVIDRVSFSESTLLDAPLKFEAGTQNIAGVIGFKTALSYLESIGYKKIKEKEDNLVRYILQKLSTYENIEIYAKDNIVGNISFNFKGITPIDIGTLLDKQGIYVRAGHHCAMPIMDSLGLDGTVRVSIGIYNTKEDVDKFLEALNKALRILG